MKKSIAIVLALSLIAPMAQAKLLKKVIIIGGAAYAANAIAKNHQKKKQEQNAQTLGNQPYHYGNHQIQNGQYQQYPQQNFGYPNQVPQSPSYSR